jgi:aminoglycoside 3'-phosphotransferase II
MSGAKVWRLQTKPPRYLKFANGDGAAALRQEAERTRWLAAQGIRVARIIGFHEKAGLAAMLTEAIPGFAADTVDGPAERVLTAVGRGLAQLHALPWRDCPFDERRAVRLARAREAVERGGINPAHFDLRNQGVSPQVLLDRLVAQPIGREDLVVAHGDATLSNLVIDEDGTTGFIDCGHAGRADRYLDLAVLAADVVEHLGQDALRTFARAYGLSRWNAAKAAYYADLYEFF